MTRPKISLLLRIKTDLNYKGSDSGIEALCNGKIDIAISSRPLSDNEPFSVKSLQMGVDIITIFVKKDSPLSNLSKNEVQKIFRCQSPDLVVIHRAKESGTQNVFEKIVLDDELGDCVNSPPDFKRMEEDEYTQLIRNMGKNYIAYGSYQITLKYASIRRLSIDGLSPDNPKYPIKMDIRLILMCQFS